MRLQIIYNMFEKDLALDNLQGLIRYKTQPNPNQTKPNGNLITGHSLVPYPEHRQIFF